MIGSVAQQKVKCVSCYHLNSFIIQTQRNSRTKRTEIIPVQNYIVNWLQYFEEHWYVPATQASERPAASPGQKKWISNYSTCNPGRSLRRGVQDSRMPRSSLQHMPRNRRNMFPYKRHIFHHPEGRDYESCMQFSSWCLQSIQTNEFFLFRIGYCDEYVIHVGWKVNKYDMRVWGT